MAFPPQPSLTRLRQASQRGANCTLQRRFCGVSILSTQAGGKIHVSPVDGEPSACGEHRRKVEACERLAALWRRISDSTLSPRGNKPCFPFWEALWCADERGGAQNARELLD